MHIALLCDTDQAVYHVGDEAIYASSAAQLQARGVAVVQVSRGHKFGPAGQRPDKSIRALEFPWLPEDRQRYLAEVRAVVAGDEDALDSNDKVFEVIDQLREVDALVIGGGGALNSRFGWLLYERLATALIVASQGKPVVLSGQSIGPDLSTTDREVLGELLDLCALVGVRDADSYRAAVDLRPDHPAIVQTIDDAVLLDVDWSMPKANRIGVTVAAESWPFEKADYLTVLAAVVDGLAERTGAEIECIPHMADPDDGGADELVHHDLAERLTNPALERRVELCEPSAQRLARCQWVVTTRFHPTVFGLLSAASVLPIGLNRYGLSRIDGALRNWGLHDGAVPFAALWDPQTGDASDALPNLLDEFVANADQERARLAAVRADRLSASARWWDRVVAVVTARPQGSEGSESSRQAESSGALEPVATSARFSTGLWARLAGFGLTVPERDLSAIAIVMRTRDRAAMLDRAVQDVLAQTAADWQLVVVNDGGSREPVDRVLARYAHDLVGRLSVIHNPVSHGMEAASNLGIANSASAFVVIHDDDDCWQPCFLQQTRAHLQSHPDEQAVTVYTDIVLEKLVGNDYVEYHRFPYWADLHGARLIDFMKVNRMVPISVFYRRDVHETIGLYDEHLRVLGDYEFYLRLLQECRVGYIDRPLADWRQRPDSTGVIGNSMFTQVDAHRDADLALRNTYFREWTSHNGIGLPMFIATTAGREAGQLSSELTAQVAQITARFDRLDAAVFGEDSRLGQLDEQLAELDTKVDLMLERVEQLQRQLRETDHAVRNGGGFNYVKRTFRAARDALGRGHDQ
ncbi:MAG: polysaccharide pyruvyl transferase family protein [Propionibacterium sp.]|jgi:polysaccharide pyruvyl transferase WcaK-like protein|nr:polysaccharide pyruvyl transferase family protein [Propionibacterium sp.]